MPAVLQVIGQPPRSASGGRFARAFAPMGSGRAPGCSLLGHQRDPADFACYRAGCWVRAVALPSGGP